jgi:hypothetical protein
MVRRDGPSLALAAPERVGSSGQIGYVKNATHKRSAEENKEGAFDLPHTLDVGMPLPVDTG